MGLKAATLAFCFIFLFATASGFDRLEPVIGIDFGRTYSRVGVYTKGFVEIIPNEQGNRSTPSWVAFTDTGRLIGAAAKNQADINPDRTIFHVQRLLGRKFDDPDVQECTNMLPYKIVNKDGKPYIEVKIRETETQVFSPEEISAMILQNMKDIAESYTGKKIQNAVMTVPAYFNDAQTQATKDAYAIAGLNVVRTITVPTATAIAYGLNLEQQSQVLVFDLGGSTFDVRILSIKFGKIKVLATSGDTHFGGEDFDNRLIDYFVKLIMKKHNKDISQDKRALGKLRKECEWAKHALSSQDQVQVEIEQLFNDVNFSEALTRARFEELNVDMFRKMMGHIKQALKEAGLEKVRELVLVGGSTRIPKVKEMLRDYFGEWRLINSVDQDETVAYGAALEGWNLRREGIHELQDIPFGTFPSWLMWAKLSLGIETAGGIMTKVIHRKTPTPIKRSHVFSTYQDNQTTVSIKVYQGERALTQDCVELGSFKLSGIPPAPRGVPQIEVTFTVDEKNALNVMAQDKATNESNSVTFSYSWDPLGLGPWDPLGLGPETQEKILEALVLAEEDRKLKEKIETNIEDMVEEYGMSTAVTCVDKFGKGCVPDYYKEMIGRMTMLEKEYMKEADRLYQETKTVEEKNEVFLFLESKFNLEDSLEKIKGDYIGKV